MLENIDLSRKVGKQDYRAAKEPLDLRLAALQRTCHEHRIPILVVFEGWDAAGKGTAINELILPLDPRGFEVHSTLAPNEEQALRPFLWRFWILTPPRGRIAIFDRSWYRRVLTERVEQKLKPADVGSAMRDIRSFERQLADDGSVIIKFFLHISKSEQKKRFKKLQENKATAWRVTKEDRKRHKQYDKYLAATEAMLAETDTDYASWTVVESHNQRFATLKIFNKVCSVLEHRLASAPAAGPSGGGPRCPKPSLR